MSTADSALLSIGSMFTKDVYKPYIRRRASPHHYLMVGKALGWLLMILLVWMACTNEDTILAWIRLKLEFMVQLSPLFLLGVYWRRLPTWAALTGVTTGTVITLGLWIGAMPKVGFFPTDAPWGISGGVWGLAVNYLICIFGGLLAWSLGPIERRAPARPV
jgi:Na+/proline symporter